MIKLEPVAGASCFMPNCGVVSVAVISGRPFETVWDYFKLKKGPAWKGRTTDDDRQRAFRHFGVRCEYRNHTEDRKKRKLRDWVAMCAEPDVVYSVVAGKHCMTILNGTVHDQVSIKPIDQHHSANRTVLSVFKIKNKA